MSNIHSANALFLTLAFLGGPILPLRSAPVPDDLEKPRSLSEPTRSINRSLAHAWKEQKLEPAPKTTDRQFLRRVSLDLLGRIATPDEIRPFVRDDRHDKRIRLVEEMLRHPDFARNWASVWTRILLSQPVDPDSFDRLHSWLEKQIQGNVSYKDLFVRLLTATGREDENGAAVYVLSHLGQPVPAKNQPGDGQFNMEPLTDHSCRAFLGLNLDCCRCHDHPFTAEITQKSWWGLNGFFRQVERISIAGPKGQPARFLLRDNAELNRGGQVLYERRNGVVCAIKATFLDGTQIKPGDKRPRRQILAELMVEQPQFSRLIVNRLWTHFLGRCMNESEPFDDNGDHNPIVHKDLLDVLARQFVSGGYDLKKLMLWICTSDAYQLQFNPTLANTQPEAVVFRSSMLSKLLGPEQRLEAMLTALRAREVLNPQQLARLRKEWLQTQIAPSEQLHETPHCPCMRPAEIPYLEEWRFHCESQELYAALSHPRKGTVARIVADSGPNSNRMLDEIYLAALNRLPTVKEVARMQKEIQALTQQKKDLTPFWQDLLWVLLQGSEFMANY